jgi:hypothetical protein
MFDWSTVNLPDVAWRCQILQPRQVAFAEPSHDPHHLIIADPVWSPVDKTQKAAPESALNKLTDAGVDNQPARVRDEPTL